MFWSSEAPSDGDFLWLLYCGWYGHPPPPPFQSPNCWRSCKLQGKIGEGEKEDGRGIVKEVRGVWNLGGMGMLSCIRVDSGMSVFVLALVVVVVLLVVLEWMVLTVLVVVRVLAVVVVSKVVQGVLVDVDCV